MKLSNKTFYWASALFLALSGLYILDRSGWLVRTLKPQAVKALSEALGRPVEVAEVSGGVFGSVDLMGLKVQASGKPGLDYSLEVPKASLVFSLWDYFVRRKSAPESVKRLDFEYPRLLLILPEQFENISSAEQGLPLATRVSGGKVFLKKGGAEPELFLEKLDAQLKGKSLVLRARLLGGALQAKGSLGGQLSGRIEGADLEGLKMLGLPLRGLSGRFSFNDGKLETEGLEFSAFGARFEGSLAWPEGEGRAWALGLSSADPALPWMSGKAKSFQAELKAAGGNWELKRLLASSDGKERLRAKGSLKSLSPTTMALSAEFLDYPLPAASSGMLSGMLEVQGAPWGLSGTVSLALSGMKLAGQALEMKSLKAKLEAGRFRLEGRGSWPEAQPLTLSAEGLLSLQSLRVRRGELKLLGKSAASFTLAKEAGKLLQSEGTLKGGRLEDWLLSLKKPQSFKGPFLLHFETLEAKQGWNLKADAGELLLASGEAFPLRAEADWAGGAWSLKSLRAREGEIAASGRWGGVGEKIRVDFKKASLPALSAALGSTPPKEAQGLLNGEMTLVDGEKVEKAFDLEAAGLRWGSLNAENTEMQGVWKGERLDIRKLSSRQVGGGTLQGKMTLDRPGREAFGKLEWKEWVFRKRAYAGRFDLEGGEKGWKALLGASPSGPGQPLTGRFGARSLKAAGSVLPDLEGSWSLGGEELQISSFSWGEGFKGKALMKPGLEFKADFEAQKADAAPLLALLGFEPTALSKPLDLHLSAQGKPVSGSAKLQWGASLDSELSWVEGRLKARASFKDLDLTQALECAFLDATAKARQEARTWSGKLLGDLAYDGGLPEPLSFTVRASSLKQADMGWSEAVAQGSASKDAVSFWRLSLGPEKARLLLREADFTKAKGGGFHAKGGFEAEDFPEGGAFRFGGEGSFEWDSGEKQGWGEARWKRLRINRRDFAQRAARVSWKGETWEAADLDPTPLWNARLKQEKGSFRLEALKAQFSADSSLSMLPTDEEEGKLDISARNVDAALVAQALDWPVDLRGWVWGNGVWRQAETRAKDRWRFSLKVENGSLESFPFDLASGVFKIEDEILDLVALKDPVRVMRKGKYEAEVSGSVPLGGEGGVGAKEMDLSVRFSNANLGLIDFLPIVDSASGTVTAELRVKGTGKYPEYGGKLEVQGGSIRFKRMLADAQDLQARLFLQDNRLESYRFDAQMGTAGQRLYIEHGAQDEALVTFDQWKPSKLNIKLLTGKSGIRMTHHPEHKFIDGNASAQLMLGGDWENPTFEGQLSLLESNVLWPIVKAGKEAPASPNDFSEKLLWNTTLFTKGKVKFLSGNAVNSEVQSDEKGLRVAGPGSDLALSGRVKAIRGRISFISADFSLDEDEESYVDFRNDLVPYVSIHGRKQVLNRDSIIKIHAFGPLGKVDVKLSSDDPELDNSRQEVGVDGGKASQARMAAMVMGIEKEDPSQVLAQVLGKGLVWLGSQWFGGIKRFDFKFKAQGLFVGSTITSEAQGVTWGVGVGGQIPGTNAYGVVGVDLNPGGDIDTSAELQVPGPGNSKITSKVGTNKLDGNYGRAGIEFRTKEDAYDSKKRYQEWKLKHQQQDAPKPKTKPTPKPSPGATRQD